MTLKLISNLLLNRSKTETLGIRKEILPPSRVGMKVTPATRFSFGH